ncbi:MAG TPA: S24 family peptidase [Tepidisphaeraceae bacterium]|jgi:phage repressor protein C with HTH and peptisase S24 domain
MKRVELPSADDYPPSDLAFTIPVDGDCQEPVWCDGDVVLFSYAIVETEGILPGKSYYIAFIDGTTTFKRVFLDEKDHGVLILRCWNRKYPLDRRVPRENVKGIARAISKMVRPEG